MALLNGKPEFAKRIKAVIHMDMVGGGPETKAVFHVTRGPMSLPSFVHDVAWSFAEWVNEESYEFAATGEAPYPMIAPEGGKEPLRAEYSRLHDGQRPRCLSGFVVRNSGDLPERLAGPLHSHQFRFRREHRSHQTQDAPPLLAPPAGIFWRE